MKGTVKDLKMIHDIVRLFWVVLFFLTPYISMLAMKVAIEERGYYALGGELCVPIMCYVVIFALILVDQRIRARIYHMTRNHNREDNHHAV